MSLLSTLSPWNSSKKVEDEEEAEPEADEEEEPVEIQETAEAPQEEAE